MNCYGITEKRVRMQRERCISRLAPDHYKHSPFGKKYKMTKLMEENGAGTDHNTSASKKTIEFSNGLEITPLDLSSSNEKKKKPNGIEPEPEVQSSGAEDSVSEDLSEKDVPLDLSSSKELERPLSPSVIEIDKTKLYEIAEKIGVSKERIDKEMAQKYEQLVRQNLRKQQKNLIKNRKRRSIDSNGITNYHHTEIENRSPTLKAITEQVVGLEEDLTILPIQTLNNGDLTITPVLGPVPKPVENRDIMRVNSFFQNQLWKPEYIGLSSWRKLRNQTYDI